jgi:hypothetical protein
MTANLRNFHMLVRHEGASYQRVQIPPGKFTVHPGSYPERGIEKIPAEALGKDVSLRAAATWQAVTRVNLEKAPKGQL